jgi:hypothetical protein
MTRVLSFCVLPLSEKERGELLSNCRQKHYSCYKHKVKVNVTEFLLDFYMIRKCLMKNCKQLCQCFQLFKF